MSVKFQLCSTNHCFLLDMQGFLRVQPSSHNRLLLKNALPALPASLISCQMGQASGAWTAWRIELAYLGDTSRLEMMSVMAIEYNMITVYIYIYIIIYTYCRWYGFKIENRTRATELRWLLVNVSNRQLLGTVSWLRIQIKPQPQNQIIIGSKKTTPSCSYAKWTTLHWICWSGHPKKDSPIFLTQQSHWEKIDNIFRKS